MNVTSATAPAGDSFCGLIRPQPKAFLRLWLRKIRTPLSQLRLIATHEKGRGSRFSLTRSANILRAGDLFPPTSLYTPGAPRPQPHSSLSYPCWPRTKKATTTSASSCPMLPRVRPCFAWLRDVVYNCLPGGLRLRVSRLCWCLCVCVMRWAVIRCGRKRETKDCQQSLKTQSSIQHPITIKPLGSV